MTFYVGQKVVCIRDHSCLAVFPGAQYPRFHGVYVIRRIDETTFLQPQLYFAEINNSHLIGHPPSPGRTDLRRFEPGFLMQFFRPIVDRATDISALKALLVPNARSLEKA